MKACLTLLPAALAALLLAGCDREPAPQPEPAPVAAPTEAAAEYAALASAYEEESAPQLRRLVVAAPGFREAVGALLKQPDAAQLEAAQNAWALLYSHFSRAWPVLASRAALTPQLAPPLARADIWPILPGYVDAVPGWPESGIVYDVTLALNTETLLAQQDMTDPAEVSVGLQVLHQLLAGVPEAPRAALDLTAVTELLPSHQLPLRELPENRRRSYLDVASALLLEDLTLLIQPREAPPPEQLLAALLQALADAQLRLAKLAAYADAGDPGGGEYMAPQAHQIASTETRAAVDVWFDPQTPQGAALAAVLEAVAPDYAGELAALLTEEPHDHAALARLLSAPPVGLF